MDGIWTKSWVIGCIYNPLFTAVADVPLERWKRHVIILHIQWEPGEVFQIDFSFFILITAHKVMDISCEKRSVYSDESLFLYLSGDMKHLHAGTWYSCQHTSPPPWPPAEDSGIDVSITPTDGLDQVKLLFNSLMSGVLYYLLLLQ